MCMPEKDQVVRTVREHINGATNWLRNQTGPGPDACNGCWTRAMKAALCHASNETWGGCSALGIHAAAGALLPQPAQASACHQTGLHICAQQPGPYGWAGNAPAQICDVTCWRHGEPEPPQQRALLAAEIAWGGRAHVLANCAHLLAVRAVVRVLICHQDWMSFGALAEHIHEYQGTQPGDTYLLAAFGAQPQNPRIVYYRIEAHQRQAEDQCELAPIAEDYYLGWGVPPVQQGNFR